MEFIVPGPRRGFRGSGRSLGRRVVVFGGVAVVVTFAAWLCFGGRVVPPVAPAERPVESRPEAPRIESARLARSEVSAGSREPTFDDYVEALVGLGVSLWKAVRAADDEQVRAIDDRARELLTELRNRIAVPEEKALFRLGGLLSEEQSTTAQVRRRVLTRIVGDGLHVRWERFRYEGSRELADRLTGSILETVPQDEQLAEGLGALLVDRPYLGAAHESLVLRLVEIGAEEEFLREVATELLLTLWRNLEEDGGRPPGTVANLALLFVGDDNPSRRLAALRHLLTAEDGRYRDLVVRQVLDGRDAAAAREVGQAAASELPAPAALKVLESLIDVGQTQLMSAFMTLGSRDAGLMRRVYEQRLAEGVQPAFRAELVTGIGISDSSEALELARFAFDHDPSLDVKSRAMFVLTATAGAEIGERTLMSALDDPRIDRDSQWIAQVVLALENVARSGATNAVARVGARLLEHPRLSDHSRGQLERILEQYLPGRGR